MTPLVLSYFSLLPYTCFGNPYAASYALHIAYCIFLNNMYCCGMYVMCQDQRADSEEGLGAGPEGQKFQGFGEYLTCSYEPAKLTDAMKSRS